MVENYVIVFRRIVNWCLIRYFAIEAVQRSIIYTMLHYFRDIA